MRSVYISSIHFGFQCLYGCFQGRCLLLFRDSIMHGISKFMCAQGATLIALKIIDNMQTSISASFSSSVSTSPCCDRFATIAEYFVFLRRDPLRVGAYTIGVCNAHTVATMQHILFTHCRNAMTCSFLDVDPNTRLYVVCEKVKSFTYSILPDFYV